MTPCPRCGALGEDPDSCARCGVVYAKWFKAQARAEAVPRPPAPAPAAAASGRFDALEPLGLDPALPPVLVLPGDAPDDRAAVLGPPTVFAAAVLLSGLGFFRGLVMASFGMELHELGHAVMNWLGARPALPLPLFTIAFDADRSVLVLLLTMGALAAVFLAARNEDCDGLARFAVGVAALELACTIFLSTPTHRVLVEGAGQAGQIVLPALLVMAFQHRFPAAARWRQARWFFLAIAAAVFVCSLERWLAARTDAEQIPWGSVFGGDGDMEHVRDAGLAPAAITRLYLTICALSAAAMIVHYAAFALPALRRLRATQNGVGGEGARR